MAANIAILIDAENVDPSFANQIFSYARSLGEVTVREIYGSGISLNEWADPILENTIHTNFTLRPNKYKNSSDIALTIGAMELLSTSRATEDKKVDAVIIASSDSDFSPLAFHLRAAGIDVIGMGEQGRINPMWPKACTEFVTLSPGQPLVRKRETLSEPQPVVQATPPIEKTTPPVLSSVEEAAPPPKPAEEMKGEAVKKNETVKIAHSHSARVQLIRSFITTQLAAHGGRMKSGELFKALTSIPDYKFDQQRSRRKPLDYLDTQYAAWFVLTPGENGSYWISLRSVADSHTEQQPVADEQPTESPVDDVADEQLAVIDEHLSAAEKETADEQPGEGQPAAEEPAAPPLPDDPRVALIEAGILVQDADRVAAILSESKNLLSAYNGLAKAFGRKQGSQYYRMIKERFETPSAVQTEVTTPSTEEETEQHTQDEQEQPHAEEPQAEATLERFLVDHDVEAAAQIASIVSSSASLRIAYNELRKAFGATEGRAYLALVKEFRA